MLPSYKHFVFLLALLATIASASASVAKDLRGRLAKETEDYRLKKQLADRETAVWDACMKSRSESCYYLSVVKKKSDERAAKARERMDRTRRLIVAEKRNLAKGNG